LGSKAGLFVLGEERDILALPRLESWIVQAVALSLYLLSYPGSGFVEN